MNVVIAKFQLNKVVKEMVALSEKDLHVGIFADIFTKPHKNGNGFLALKERL